MTDVSAFINKLTFNTVLCTEYGVFTSTLIS